MDELTGVADVPVETPEVVEVAPPESIADHAAQFDPKRQAERDAAESAAPSETPAAPTSAAAPAKVDTKPQRHRATKDRATAADAPRIIELKRQLKELQDKQSAVASPAAVAAPVAPRAAEPTPVVNPHRWLGDARTDPEPQEKDFGGDPMRYLSARFQWEARGVNRYERHEAQQQQQQMDRATSWAQRVEKAAETKADYAAVAFGPTTIPAGSPVDQFIDADDNGAEVLYYLQSNPDERDAVLRLPVHQQLKHLALLSQRYDTASSSAVQAGKTGSVARTNIRIMPSRPPNPVRTGSQSASGGPPPTDGSLSISDHAKQFAPQARRR